MVCAVVVANQITIAGFRQENASYCEVGGGGPDEGGAGPPGGPLGPPGPGGPPGPPGPPLDVGGPPGPPPGGP